MRLTVKFILTESSHWAIVAEIIEEYQGLDEADIRAC
jgi:uncharacterized protein (DUF433 family)